jgi:hypothetical protein
LTSLSLSSRVELGAGECADAALRDHELALSGPQIGVEVASPGALDERVCLPDAGE